MNRLNLLLYPELRLFDERERGPVLARARRAPFDLVELLGMAAAAVLVTAASRYGAAAGPFPPALASAAVALPLLAATMGPFLYRRTRRGLQQALRQTGA